MASLIQGYENDIFISYRQKDNKGDRWVSEFVEALRIELESTCKEDVNVYFDINPHDGLLETHDVNASLKEKLKCLVFIPVISRTYCDPNSFAWENEFKAFVETASSDQLGLKINLPNGNVASRVLPIRIHELDKNDILLCEALLGGVLRGIDFVYKSTGVNRPLRMNEDHPQDNLNKTYYRDQINKVANAIDEILLSLKREGTGKKNFKSLDKSPSTKTSKRTERTQTISSLRKIFQKKFILAFSLILGLCIAGAFVIHSFLSREDTKKTLAILPFRLPEDDPELISISEMITEIALIKLHKVKNLTLRSRISTYQYRESKKTLNTIRKELNVSYLVEGSIRREGDKILLFVGLTDAKNNKQLWSKEFVLEKNQMSAIVSDITKNIAYGSKTELSIEELNQIDNDPTKSNTAYLKYISANVISNNAWNLSSTGNIITDSAGFIKAVKEYDNAIKDDSLFAGAYANRAIAMTWGYFTGQFDSSCFKLCRKDITKAREIDNDLTDAQVALGFYYYYCETDYQKALVHFNRASVKDPENYQPLFYMAMVYRRMGDWGKSQSLISRVIKQNPQVALFLTNIGLSYTYLHKFDSALLFHQKAIDIMPNWYAPYVNKIDALVLKEGSTSNARLVLESATKNTGERLQEIRILLDIYDGNLKNALSKTAQSNAGDFAFSCERYLTFAKIFYLLNNTKNAEVYYDSALVCLNEGKMIEKNARIHSLFALAYAGKGNRVKALEETKLALDLKIRDATEGGEMKLVQAQVYTMLGDYDDAIINIEYMLENPSVFSVRLLQLDPVWKPLLNISEMKSLIKAYSKN